MLALRGLSSDNRYMEHYSDSKDHPKTLQQKRIENRTQKFVKRLEKQLDARDIEHGAIDESVDLEDFFRSIEPRHETSATAERLMVIGMLRSWILEGKSIAKMQLSSAGTKWRDMHAPWDTESMLLREGSERIADYYVEAKNKQERIRHDTLAQTLSGLYDQKYIAPREYLGMHVLFELTESIDTLSAPARTEARVAEHVARKEIERRLKDSGQVKHLLGSRQMLSRLVGSEQNGQHGVSMSDFVNEQQRYIDDPQEARRLVESWVADEVHILYTAHADTQATSY